MKEGVVLLHGIFRTHRSMKGLERHLNANGFQVLNIGYASTRLTLEDIVTSLHPRISEFAAHCPAPLHYVGYSMGGLVVRAYLHRYAPLRVGRIVMIGTPNHGSEVADFLQHWWLYRKLYGPAGQQLITCQESFSHLFGDTPGEVGIIAGRFRLDPLGNYLIRKEHDGKVSVESTRLEGMKAHTIVPVSHSLMPHSRTIWRLTQRFLQLGQF